MKHTKPAPSKCKHDKEEEVSIIILLILVKNLTQVDGQNTRGKELALRSTEFIVLPIICNTNGPIQIFVVIGLMGSG